MKKYLVGGAVRDKLLKLPIKEKDWVVVGSNVNEMLQLGFRQVGKDFPVFLHPETNEEYALARLERKVSKGYTGFTFDTAETVTLEEDLKRRDLTINAMAETEDGVLIDPYHGKEDLEKKLLRHVSAAFIEDPVRILRVARFAARFNFNVAPETNALMKKMVSGGEIDALVPERVWKEFEKGLAENFPEKFFKVLDDCGALIVLFPQIQLKNLGLLALTRSVHETNDLTIRFAVLMYDLTGDEIKTFCQQYKVPTDYSWLALFVHEHIDEYRHCKQLSPEQMLTLLEKGDAFRREERFQKFLKASSICVQSQEAIVTNCMQAAKQIDIKNISKELKGPEISVEIRKKRLQAIEKVLHQPT